MATEILRPNAGGDECNIPYESGAACPNHFQNVDEVPADGDSTTVYGFGSGPGAGTPQRDLYNITNHSAGSGTINNITVYARCKGETLVDQNSLWIVIKSTNVHQGAQKTVTLAWKNYSEQWATNPDNAHAWTWDEIDALQIGIAVTRCAYEEVYNTFCTQVYVVVNYTPSAEQELTASPVATASSVQNGAIAGSGNAPLTSSPVAVASSIQQAALTPEGEAPLTASPISVASSVQTAVIETVWVLVASPVVVTSSVQNASIAGTGVITLTAAAIAVASSIQNAALAAVGAVILTSAPIQVTSSIVAAVIAGSGFVALTASPVAVITSVLAARVYMPGRPLSLIIITSQYRKVNVITGYD